MSTPFTIAVASGKGGTGKTLVATNIAAVEAAGASVILADCDVDAPNAGLFFELEQAETNPVTATLASVIPQYCVRCGRCSEACAYGAIRVLGSTAVVFDELCHGCGVCSEVCEYLAIEERQERVGEVTVSSVAGHDGLTLVSGTMDVGQVKAPEIIRAVRSRAQEIGADLTIIDAPPGVACSAVASLKGVDAVLLVTEPTPFGLHDLELAAKLARDLGRPMGVIVNRVGTGSADIDRFCDERDIPVVGHLPFDRTIAEAYARGALVLDEVSGMAGWLEYVVPSLRTISGISVVRNEVDDSRGASIEGLSV